MCMQSTLMEHHPHLAHTNGVAMSPVTGTFIFLAVLTSAATRLQFAMHALQLLHVCILAYS